MGSSVHTSQMLTSTTILVGVLCTTVSGGILSSFQPASISAGYNHSRDLVGEPLFVTPLLEQGKWKEAQDLAAVKLLEAKDVQSYSGFVTVNKNFGSNMFFWYFPSEYKPETAPLIIWLQGGPGGSSLFGLFIENGPIEITDQGKVKKRSTSWSLTHNIVYLDNPVGTGFSFTKNGYAENETAVAEDLFDCLIQLYTLFPNLKDSDLFITGESYAGKYVPSFAYRVHKENELARKNKERLINLKGIAVGDGLIDPISQLAYGDYLYNIGLIDEKQKAVLDAESEKAYGFIKNKDWKGALNQFDIIVNGDFHPSYFQNMTGYEYYFNFLISSQPECFDYYPRFLEKPSTRKALHVGNLPYSDDAKTVEEHLAMDMMQSVRPKLEELINHDYRVLIYNGQLDIIIATPLTLNMVKALQWKGKADFDKAERKMWRINSDLAGYSKSSGNFTLLQVRGAGHMVPYDQPMRAFDMINRFTAGKPFA